MADIFVSYTSDDRDWAFWIGQELEKLGHTAHVHDWEISGGGNIMAWMEERHDKADSVLCVVGRRYLDQPYSALERHGAQWAAASKRPNFLLPVFIESCEAPTLLASLKRCDLHGLNEDDARARLATFMKPAAKPTGQVPFPGVPKPSAAVPTAPVAFPGGPRALSNIPISVPRFFLGRDEVLDKIKIALANDRGRVAITALHGLRGVGKTTLAAAYAERHRGDYRATWWIRAETESTMRADLVGLGVRLGWVASEEKEEPALSTVSEWLQVEGDGILLVYDNANNADEIRPYMPRVSAAQIIVTSNAPDWRGVAAPVQIEVWPTEVGADYLIARIGGDGERNAALALSEALGGLPLAHEQAAAYCERLGISFADYLKRIEANPAKLLSTQKDAPYDYGRTVAATFALAIDEAAKLHPAAESLIVYAALLAPEPIPLFLFSEGREQFGKKFALAVAGDGLDEAVAALRAFALVDRETIADERDASISTDCIRLHRLVRQVALARRKGVRRATAVRELVDALADVYPLDVFHNPHSWPSARRLDAHTLAIVGVDATLPEGAEESASFLLDRLSAYRQGSLAAYNLARPLSERALAIREKALNFGHAGTASILNNLGALLRMQGDLAGARTYYERALSINEKALGIDHPDTASCLGNLGDVLQQQGNLKDAQPHEERALAIREKVLGQEHPDTATSLNNLGGLLREQGDLAGSKSYFGRALAVREKVLGPDHPHTALTLNNLGSLLWEAEGDFAGARLLLERALAIRERVLGPDHPNTATSLNSLGRLLQAKGDLAGARPFIERSLAIREKVLGPGHTDTATSLNNLGTLLQAGDDPAGARPYLERALAIFKKMLGAAHPSTKNVASNTAGVLEALKCRKEAKALRKKFGIKG